MVTTLMMGVSLALLVQASSLALFLPLEMWWGVASIWWIGQYFSQKMESD